MANEWQVILFTLGVCLLSTLLITPFGLGLAWLLARKRWRGKAIVEALVTVPLVIPPVATGLILLKLFGRRSGIGAFLHDQLGIEIVFTWKAVVIACAVMSFPLLVRGARVGLEGVDRSLEDVARIFGAGPWRVFFSVTLPLAGRWHHCRYRSGLCTRDRGIRRDDSGGGQHSRPDDHAFAPHLRSGAARAGRDRLDAGGRSPLRLPLAPSGSANVLLGAARRRFKTLPPAKKPADAEQINEPGDRAVDHAVFRAAV
jgi:hypothetical protein